MAPPRPATPTARAFAAAVLAASLVACAGLVGADFDSVHGVTTPETEDSGVVVPTLDAQPQPPAEDGSHVVPVDDGGACPTRFLLCSGQCFDISTSPAHCGSCGTTCPGDPNGAAVCVASHCELACNMGYDRCPTGCCPVVYPDAAPADDAGDDASSGADAGVDAGPPPASIPCAATTCAVGSQFCCADARERDGAAPGDVCVATQNDTSGITCPYIFACAGTADCQGPGGVCCYDPSSNQQDPNYQESFCAQDCSGPYLQLCTPGANDCNGGVCTGQLVTPGQHTTYSFCQ